MLGAKLRPVIEPFTTGIGRGLARVRLTPNMLTTLGLLGTFACAWLIAIGERFLGGILLIIPMVIDVLDGATARAMGRVTTWGGFYDAVCDRLGDGAILAGIAWAARTAHPRELAAALAALVLTMCVPYARAKAEAYGLTTVAGPGERAERAVILIAGLILGTVEATLWILVALTGYTIVTRCIAVWKQTAVPRTP